MRIVLLLAVVCLNSCTPPESNSGVSTPVKNSPVQDEAKKEQLGNIMREMYQLRKKAEGDPVMQKDRSTRDRIIQLQSDARAIMNELTGGDRKKEKLLTEEIMQRFVPEAYGEFMSTPPDDTQKEKRP